MEIKPIFLLLLLVLVSRTLSFVCPQDYFEYGGHCYRIANQSANWTDAVDACQSEGGDLVSINSPEENTFLKGKLPHIRHGYWIGMVYTNNRYMWLDGTEVNFTDWGGKNPDCMSTHLHCKALLSSPLHFKWADLTDGFDPYYICEISPVVCPQDYFEYGGHCYRIANQSANWTDAVDACQREGGDLVSINSPEENTFLKGKLPHIRHGYWIGMVYTNSKYMWLDGTEVNFTDWGGKNPDCMSSHSHCKALLASPLHFQWADLTDGFDPYYICEISPTKMMTVTVKGSSSGQIPGSLVDIKLFTDSAFSQPLQGSVPAATPVYVQVLSHGHPLDTMVVDSCTVDSETTTKPHPLIQHHCSVDPDTNIIAVKDQMTRFKFTMFNRANDNDDVKVTCNLVFCDPLDFSSRCRQTCNSGSNLIG